MVLLFDTSKDGRESPPIRSHSHTTRLPRKKPALPRQKRLLLDVERASEEPAFIPRLAEEPLKRPEGVAVGSQRGRLQRLNGRAALDNTIDPLLQMTDRRKLKWP